MSSCFIIAPIGIEALHVHSECGYLAVEQMANFRYLPYCDRDYIQAHSDKPKDSTQNPPENQKLSEQEDPNKGRDVYAGTAYISENIVSQPFQNRNLHLLPGIHLYWALPDPLKTGTQKEEDLSFPTVPNRWLVIRRRGNTIESQWIVESDYLWPEVADPLKSENPWSVCIPNPAAKQKHQQDRSSQPKNPPPFRYLGRQLSLKEWVEDKGDGEYWGKDLTAIGYGEPAFAAFYPNCYSVFGCRDTHIRDIASNLSYEVIGWHSDAEFDYLRSLIGEYSSGETLGKSGLSLPDFIQDKTKWKLDEKRQEIPNDIQTLYYGCLEFQPDDESQETLRELEGVVLANSGTEALSAYIAHQIEQKDRQLSKVDIENQFEAIQLLSSLKDERYDLDKKLREARHEKGFIARSSGLLWTIEKIDDRPNSDLAGDRSKSSETLPLELPEEIADRLKEINGLQTEYDAVRHQIEWQQQQIFADWYKYLICLYPPIGQIESYPRPEAVREFVRGSEIAQLEERQAQQHQFRDTLNQNLEELERTLNALNLSLKETDRDSFDRKPPEYKLKPVPAPRYWQPNEPVVMVVFKSDKNSTVEPPREDPIDCLSVTLEHHPTDKKQFAQALAQNLRTTLQGKDKKQYTRVWRSQSWQPFLLEWEVRVTNVKSQRDYFADFIDRHYQTDAQQIDFPLPDNLNPDRDALKDVYSGRNLLTEYAAERHREQIEAFFTQKSFFEDFSQEQSIEATRGWLTENLGKFKEWLSHSEISQSKISTPQKQLFERLLAVYESFQNQQCLSQALNGFNQALLGRKQTLQLPIDDPIGFESDRLFVELVRDAVQDRIISAPQPLNFFNPIRAGSLKITRLRLVDTFGRVRDLDLAQTQIITPEHLATDLEDAANLPPRIVQPARLHFRWLSGNPQHTREEASSHPSLNPICGWILPDRIDRTLEIYNTQGGSLGELEIKKAGSERWRPAPGSEFAVNSIEDIPNPHLKRVVRYLDECDDRFLGEFVDSLAQAWEQIEPEVTDSNPSLGLLMGQPMAVVRACLDLQLQGVPAINQDWGIFKRELQEFQASQQAIERETNGFTNVRFPFYLGNHQSFSDGLVGYWRETHRQTDSGQEISLSPTVYLPLGKDDDTWDARQTKKLVRQHQPLSQTVRSPPELITALIDPRASIQVVSRILPVKSIQIPREHYVKVLDRISFSFLAAPLLSPGKMWLPLPDVPDVSFSWLEKQSLDNQNTEAWLEVSLQGQIERDRFIDAATKLISKLPENPNNLSGAKIWDYLLVPEVGWLKHESKYWIVPMADRPLKRLEPPYDRLQKQIDILLDTLADKVRPTTTEAVFAPQEIREGWLRLKPLS